ncbi:MAG: integration host factor subunit beta [Treponema sp.]|nr:integration host factor subunit beta [Treponema sp.]
MAGKKITKYDLVEAVYLNANKQFDKNQVQKVVEIFLDQIKGSLENGNTIELRGFGTFEPRLRKGRSKARNPRTGASLSVAPHYVAAFRAGQELKNSLLELPVTEKE